MAPRHPSPLFRSALALAVHAALLALGCAAPPAGAQAGASTAQADALQDYQIAPGPLDEALLDFAARANVSLTVPPALLQGLRSAGLRGRHAVADGFARLLAGSGLQAVQTAPGAYVLRRAAPSGVQEGAGSVGQLRSVTVTAKAQAAGELPQPYAGGQVARGGRLGMLGDKDVMDVPFNVTSFTSALIENQQAATVADILDNDPAVRISARGRNTSVGGGDNFFLRGFTLANRDIALNGLYGVLPYGSLSLETVERVEVLKGPGALLNGMAPSGGVGGAINVVPKRATDLPITRLTLSHASDSRSGGHLDLGRRWGPDNAFGVRANAVYRDGATAVAGQSAELAAAAVGADYRGERLRLSADIGYQEDGVRAATAGHAFDASLSAIPPAPKASARFGQAWEERRFRDRYAALHAEYEVSDMLTLHAAAGTRAHRHTNLRARSSIVDAQGNLALMPEYYPESSTAKSLLVGARIGFDALAARHVVHVSAASLRADASLGYAWWDAFASNLYQPTAIAEPGRASAAEGGFFDIRKANERRTTSWGVADTMAWHDGAVQLLLGVRRQQVTQDNHDIWSPGTPFVSRYSQAALSPAVGVVVRPRADTSLYANYIEGLSPGETAPADAENAGEVFPPVKTRQKEVGVKVDLGRVTGTLALFEIRQPNAITVAGRTPTAYRYAMDGERRNRGVEFSAAGEPLRGLRLIGGATYTQAKQVRTQDGAYDGRNAVAVPRWMANLALDADVPQLPGLAWSARVLVTGAQHMNPANTLQLPGWTRWDLGVRYSTRVFERPVTLRANILNVANRSYWESSGGSAGILLGAPRTLNLAATIDF